MDSKERYSDPQAVYKAAIAAALTGLWTALPGYIVDFDAASVTATVQPGILGTILDYKGAISNPKLPLLVKVPVIFPGGGGCRLTFPVRAGDECLVVFASRAVGAWKQSGGAQTVSDSRKHDLSDGFAIIGPMSQANKISGISTTKTQLRSDDGNAYVELDPAGHIVNVVAPGGMTITTPTLHITGDVNVDQTVTATTDVVGGGKSLKTHVHTGVTSGSSNSGPPA